jgi:D-glycero-D-manno-heptose 1,7-bisphosphate phosphatase
MKKAVFLDRDGTINEEVGYLSDLKQLRLIPGAARAIKRLNDAHFLVVLVTNQSGIARGYFTEAFVQETHVLLRKMLKEQGAHIDAVYYCPHHPKSGESAYTRMCECRKPGIGMIEQAVRDMHIDVRSSYVIGDKWSDVELGQRAGTRAILVSTGYKADDPGNKRPDRVREPDLIASTLGDAADWILKHATKDKS